MGHIVHDKSIFSSLVVLIKKNDGSFKMCIDYCKLNKRTIKNVYLIPRIDELLVKLHDAFILTKINLRIGHH